MDAISLLQKQHRKAESALKKLTRGYDRAVLNGLANEIAAHMVIEEAIFYPAVGHVSSALVLESYEEHAMAQFELKRLLATDGRDPRFEARAKALMELLEHHIGEEEKELFPEILDSFDDETLRSLGQLMAAKFDDLVRKGHDAVLPHQPSRVTGDRQSERFASSDGLFVAMR